ncbi:HipA family kinase [Lederbergia wuyishanensis]|uniref:HipA-like kinase domain-containing protein n=1 Tax=Lederbergia wuyishanensis TaxID=1347903 RepID=A0ABU0D0H9_9BACI|nr:HipA family kinase [Lederbergia wuyishanensis]MCJ8006533.1 hypothetical protein [Lederbergia wuyishanensis]MDQ0341912.1 hypothetical protein [Lederbergia wuyishanensis]
MIKPLEYKKTLDGKSNAHLITFDDGKDYVVKYFQPGFDKALPNEWVSYCLGRYLGLPIPFSKIVEVPPEFSANIPELQQMSDTQFHFASMYIPECINGHEVNNVTEIINFETLASIILFDYWLNNHDRTRKNILLLEKEPQSYQLWAIDHAEVFGSYNWLLSDMEIQQEQIMKSATHQFMAMFIKDENTFYEQLELIQTMPTFLIEETVSLIPEEWNVSREERKAIVSTLNVRRKKILPNLLEKVIREVYRPLH